MSLQGIEFKHLVLDSNRLVADYLAGREQANRFYGGRWDDLKRLKNLAGQIDKNFDRGRAAAILAAQRGFGLLEDGRELLDSFVSERGFIVTSGQQPVLFGGPLYILYKCVDVIATAARYAEYLGRPVLPVFWNASEDHDLLEASSIALPDQANELRTVELPAQAGNYIPLCQLPLGESLGTARALLDEITPATDYRPWLFGILDLAYNELADYGHAFSGLLAGLFANRGLFVVDACSPELRRSAPELFEQEIFDAAAGAELFERTSAELESTGYPVQVKPQADDTSLFILQGGRRVKLQRAGDGFALKGTDETRSEAEIRSLLAESPEIFSPGVRMRPLLESMLFGSLTYLAGPGEISYYAQMRPLYELRGLAMPLIAPRLSGVIVEAKIARVLDKYAVDWTGLEAGADKLATGLLAQEGEWSELARQIGDLRGEIKRRLDSLGKLVDRLDPTMRGPLGSTAGALSGNLDKLEGKLTQAARRGNDELLSQLRKAEVNLWPGGKRQERAISWLYYLVRYGEDLLGWLIERAGEKG